MSNNILENYSQKSYINLFSPEKSFCYIFTDRSFPRVGNHVILTEKNAYIQNIYHKVFKMVRELAFLKDNLEEEWKEVACDKKTIMSSYILDRIYEGDFKFWFSNREYYDSPKEYDKWLETKEGRDALSMNDPHCKCRKIDGDYRPFEGHDESVKRFVIFFNEETEPISIVITVNNNIDVNVFDVIVKYARYNFDDEKVKLLKSTTGNKYEDLKLLSIEHEKIGKKISEKHNLSIMELRDYLKYILGKYLIVKK